MLFLNSYISTAPESLHTISSSFVYMCTFLIHSLVYVFGMILNSIEMAFCVKQSNSQRHTGMCVCVCVCVRACVRACVCVCVLS